MSLMPRSLQFIMTLIFSSLSASALATGAAKVDFAVGSVSAVTANGVARILTKGDQVISGETVRTDSGARAQLRFNDDAMVSLQPNTVFRLDDYHFSGKDDAQARGFFSLLKGGLRTITGLIGRNNRDSYKVTTTVATIGIRGTEYTIAYTGEDSVAIATGEGAIEVCTQSGCGVLASGESGKVKGATGSLQRTNFRPLLSPAQPNNPLLATFSTSEFRNADGSLQLNAGQLVSGGGYTLSWAHNSLTGSATDATAEFSDSSQLLYATNASGYFKGMVLGESGASDGVIGWGRWVTATDQLGTSLNNFHYVIGRETPVSSLTALGGTTAVYQLVGYTTPTGSLGYSTGAVTGSLTANFTGAKMNVTMDLKVPYFNSMVNTTYSVSRTTGNIDTASTFVWTGGSNKGGGLFSGVNASHAGATYNFDAAGYTTVSGAVAFKR